MWSPERDKPNQCTDTSSSLHKPNLQPYIMGKDWKGKDGHRGGGGRGGGRGGGGGNSNDLSSCREYAAVIGTCDAARERESSKELCNLLTQAIEKLGLSKEPEIGADAEDENPKMESIEDMLRNEVQQLKNQSKRGAQDVVSIQTGIKGIVFVKISRRDVCPVQLVKSVFDQVTIDKVPCSRHLVKMIPLQLAFFAGEEDFVEHMKTLVEGTFINPGAITLPRLQLNRNYKRKVLEVEAAAVAAAEALSKPEDAPADEEPPLKKACIDTEADASTSVAASKEATSEVLHVTPESAVSPAQPAEPAVAEPTEVKPEIKYLVLFKARNHNILNKGIVLQHTRTMMPRHLRQDYMLGKVSEKC